MNHLNFKIDPRWKLINYRDIKDKIFRRMEMEFPERYFPAITGVYFQKDKSPIELLGVECDVDLGKDGNVYIKLNKNFLPESNDRYWEHKWRCYHKDHLPIIIDIDSIKLESRLAMAIGGTYNLVTCEYHESSYTNEFQEREDLLNMQL